MKCPCGGLLCSDSSEIFLCLTAHSSWLILEISFLNCLLMWLLHWVYSTSSDWCPSPSVCTCGSETSVSIPLRPGKGKGQRENPRHYPQNIHGEPSGLRSPAMEFHSSYLSKCLFFPSDTSVALVAFTCCPCASIISFLSDWEGDMTDRHQAQGQLLPPSLWCPCLPEAEAPSQCTGVVMSWDLRPRCSPTASSRGGIGTSMACSVWMFPSTPVGQGQLWQELRECCFTRVVRGKRLEKDLLKKRQCKWGGLETPSKGSVSFCLASGHVVLTAFISKIWWTSSLLHSTIAQSGENTFCCWVLTESCSIDLVTLSCSCETAKGQNAFQQKHISPVQKATQAPYLAAMHVRSRYSIKKLPNQLPL